MKINPKTSGNWGPRPIPKVDSYIAKNVAVIDLGTQETEWKGQKKWVRKVYLAFELLGTKAVFNEDKGEQPFLLSEQFTYSLGEKANLRKFVESWRGKSVDEMLDSENNFDLIKELAGKYAFITVRHDKGKKDPSKVYANIGSISPVPSALQAQAKTMKAENPLLVYDFEDESRQKDWEKIPQWLQKVMLSAKEVTDSPFSEESSAAFPDQNAPDEF